MKQSIKTFAFSSSRPLRFLSWPGLAELGFVIVIYLGDSRRALCFPDLIWGRVLKYIGTRVKQYFLSPSKIAS